MDMIEKTLRNLSYGLYLIGVEEEGRPCGCIVNTVFQITSENPMIATSMNKDNYTWDLMKRTADFLFPFFPKRQEKK